MMLADNVSNVLGDLRRMLFHSDLTDMAAGRPEDAVWDAALSMTLGKQGYRPPWPRKPAEAAAWEIRQIKKMLQQAEVLVISPAAHAAVMAAAATLEPADVSTLDRDQDILVPTGLLVLPEPVVVVNRTGTLSDTRAFGWQFVTQHQGRFPVMVANHLDCRAMPQSCMASAGVRSPRTIRGRSLS
jgi:hypothetical protein